MYLTIEMAWKGAKLLQRVFPFVSFTQSYSQHETFFKLHSLLELFWTTLAFGLQTRNLRDDHLLVQIARREFSSFSHQG